MSSASVTRDERPRRRWFQFSLATLLTVIAAAAVTLAWYARHRRSLEPIRIHIGSSMSVDSHSGQDLGELLADRSARWRASGINPSCVPVLIQVDDDATHAQFRSVIESGWSAGLRTFVLDRFSDRQGLRLDLLPQDELVLLDEMGREGYIESCGPYVETFFPPSLPIGQLTPLDVPSGGERGGPAQYGAR
jgi:hypothetical protein